MKECFKTRMKRGLSMLMVIALMSTTLPSTVRAAELDENGANFAPNSSIEMDLADQMAEEVDFNEDDITVDEELQEFLSYAKSDEEGLIDEAEELEENQDPNVYKVNLTGDNVKYYLDTNHQNEVSSVDFTYENGMKLYEKTVYLQVDDDYVLKRVTAKGGRIQLKLGRSMQEMTLIVKGTLPVGEATILAETEEKRDISVKFNYDDKFSDFRVKPVERPPVKPGAPSSSLASGVSYDYSNENDILVTFTLQAGFLPTITDVTQPGSPSVIDQGNFSLTEGNEFSIKLKRFKDSEFDLGVEEAVIIPAKITGATAFYRKTSDGLSLELPVYDMSGDSENFNGTLLLPKGTVYLKLNDGACDAATDSDFTNLLTPMKSTDSDYEMVYDFDSSCKWYRIDDTTALAALYVGFIPKKIPLILPEGASISLSEDSNATISKDQKYLEFVQYGGINFQIVSDTNKLYTVSYSIYDEELEKVVYKNVDYYEGMDYGYSLNLDANIREIKVVERKASSVNFKTNHGMIYDIYTGNELNNQTLYLAPDANVSVGVSVDEGYELEYVTVNGQILEANVNDLSYMITGTGEKLEVVASIIPKSATFTLSNSSGYTAVVDTTTGSNVRYDLIEKLYRVRYNATKVVVRVTVPINSDLGYVEKEPVLYARDVDGVYEEIEGVIETKTADECIYRFDIATKYLEEEAFVFIGKEDKEHTVTLTYDENKTDSVVIADENGTVIAPTDFSEENDTITYKYNLIANAVYKMEVCASSCYNVGEIKMFYSGITDRMKIYEQKAVRSFITTEDIKINIDGSIVKTMEVSSKNEIITPVTANQLKADYQIKAGEYVVRMLGANGYIPFKITGRAFWDKNHQNRFFDSLIVRTTEGIKPATRIELDGGVPVIEVGTNISRVNLIFEDGQKFSASFTQVGEVNRISVKTIGDYLLTSVDRRQSVAVYGEVNGYVKNIDWGPLEVTYECPTYKNVFGETKELFTAEVLSRKQARASTRGMLYITTGDATGEGTITIKYENLSCTYKVKVQGKSLDTLNPKKPDIKVIKRDDVSATIRVKGFVDEDGHSLPTGYKGKQFYQIDVTAKDSVNGEERPATIPVTKRIYVERELPVFPEDFEDDEEQTKSAKIESDFYQDIKLDLVDAPTGLGAAWEYDIDVCLVQAKIGLTQEDLVKYPNALYEGTEKVNVEVKTLAPVFETGLKLSKKATTIYTGQTNILAAEGIFSKSTTVATLTAKDDSIGEGEKLLVDVVNQNKISLSTTANTKVGNHSIQVLPVSTSSMYANPILLNIAVVQGIEDIDIDVPSSQIYKNPKTAASLVSTITYNKGKNVPKKKSVVYEITNTEGYPISDDNPLYGNVTVKAGKVTVAKNFNPTENVQFRIKATAADYAGNPTYGLSKIITIKADPLQIAQLKLFKPLEDGTYELLSENALTTLSAEDVDGVVVAAFEQANTTSHYYEKTLIRTMLSTSEYTLKSSNNKALKVVLNDKGLYELMLVAPGKTVNITATTADGGKKSIVKKLKLDYYKPTGNLDLVIKNGAFNPSDKVFEVIGNDNTVYLGKVVEKTVDDQIKDLPGFTNYSISVKGARILTSNFTTGEFSYILTGEKANITLVNKALPRKDVGYSQTITVKNLDYKPTAGPAIKVGSKLKSNTLASQDLVLTASSKKYNLEGKSVLVEIDSVSANSAKASYEAFVNSGKEIGSDKAVKVQKEINAKGVNIYSIPLHFKDTLLSNGKYKIRLTFGVNMGDDFIADSKSVVTTIQVAKPPVIKGAFTFTANYKLKVNADGSGYMPATLTGKKNHVNELFFSSKALNANIKGKENKFNDYFELAKVGDDTVVRLKSNLNDDQIKYIKSSAGANDRIAYVSYQVSLGDDGYGNPYSVATYTKKITVKF